MKKWKEIGLWVIETMFQEMPIAKCVSLDNTMTRNMCFTSEAVPEHCYLYTYKEGWYFVAEGCQCRFSVWAFDCDGEFVFGRKPAEKTLHMLWVDSGSQYDIPWKIALDRLKEVA